MTTTAVLGEYQERMDLPDDTLERSEEDYLGIRGELAKYLDCNGKEKATQDDDSGTDNPGENGHENGDSYDEESEYGEGELLGSHDINTCSQIVEEDECEMHISEIANTNHQNDEQLNVDLDEKSSRKDKQDTPEEILSFCEQEQELNEATELYPPSEKVTDHGVQSHDASVDNDGENGQEKEMEAKEGQVELVQNENRDLRQTQIADLREDTETDEEQTEDEAEGVCDDTDEETDESEEPREQTEEEERKEDESRHEDIIQAGKDEELEAITEGEINEESLQEQEHKQEEEKKDEEHELAVTENDDEEEEEEEEEEDDDEEENNDEVANIAEQEEVEDVVVEEQQEVAVEQQQQQQQQVVIEEEEEEEEEEEVAEQGENDDDEEEEIKDNADVSEEEDNTQVNDEKETKEEWRKETSTAENEMHITDADYNDIKKLMDGGSKDKVLPGFRRKFYHSDTTSSINSMHVNGPSSHASDVTDSSSDESDARPEAYSPKSETDEADEGGTLLPHETTPNGSAHGYTEERTQDERRVQGVAIKCKGKLFNGKTNASENIPSVYVSQEYGDEDAQKPVASANNSTDVPATKDKQPPGETTRPVGMVTADSSQSGRVKELGKLFDRGDPIFPKSMLSKDSSQSSDDNPMSVRKFRAFFETDQPVASKTRNQGSKERKEEVSGPPTGTVQNLRGMFENPQRNSKLT